VGCSKSRGRKGQKKHSSAKRKRKIGDMQVKGKGLLEGRKKDIFHTMDSKDPHSTIFAIVGRGYQTNWEGGDNYTLRSERKENNGEKHQKKVIIRVEEKNLSQQRRI